MCVSMFMHMRVLVILCACACVYMCVSGGMREIHAYIPHVCVCTCIY